MPNINEGKPWSEDDVYDLKDALDHGVTMEEAAEFLSRSIEEVEAKVAELGLTPPEAPT